jgi:hypothetical protein
MTTTRRWAAVLAAVILGACGSQAQRTVTEVQLTPPSPAVPQGLSMRLAATAIYSDASREDVTARVGWSSSDEAVATVAQGQVTAGVRGVSVVRARLGELEAAQVVTVVDARLMALAVSAAAPGMPRGTSLQLAATGTFSDGSSRDLTWQADWSCPDGRLSFGAPGTAVGREVGQALAVARLSGVAGQLAVAVGDAEVVSVRLAATQDRLPLGLQARVSVEADFTDGSTRDVTADASVTSTDPAVVDVAADHLLVTRGIGSAWLTASLSGHQAQRQLEVTPAELVDLQVSPPVAEVAAGQQLPYLAIGTFTDGTQADVTSMVTWQSSDAAVAQLSNALDSLGVAFARVMGQVVVTAVDPATGLSASGTLSVQRGALVGIDLGAKSVSLGVGQTLQLVATGTFSDGSTDEVTAGLAWLALLPGVVEVGEGGLLTAVGPGKVTVLAYDPANPLAFRYLGVTVK